MLQNIKLIIQDFEIFSQTLCPPPSFMVGGGYFGVCRTAEYDGCCKPNSWMQLILSECLVDHKIPSLCPPILRPPPTANPLHITKLSPLTIIPLPP